MMSNDRETPCSQMLREHLGISTEDLGHRRVRDQSKRGDPGSQGNSIKSKQGQLVSGAASQCRSLFRTGLKSLLFSRPASGRATVRPIGGWFGFIYQGYTA